MIEKKIYYVWIGNAKKPDIFYKCLKSWQEKLPDFEIVEINEKNFDIEGHLKKNRFFRECYERKLWAYMSDYIRVHYMYENSGIYVDTDMEIIKNISPLIENEKMKFFIGYEDEKHISVGIFGTDRHNEILKNMIEFYEGEIWEKPLWTIPKIFTYIFEKKYGLTDKRENTLKEGEVTIYPKEYFYPYGFREKYSPDCIKENTYGIHWWNDSWSSLKARLFLESKHLTGIPKLIKKMRIIARYYLVEKDKDMKGSKKKMKVLKKILKILLFMSVMLVAEGKELRIMTYNIYGARLANGIKLGESIKKYKPDFVSLQEVDKNTKRSNFRDVTFDIAVELGYNYYYFQKSRDFDSGEFGISFISKYPVEKIYAYELPSIGAEKRQVVIAELEKEEFGKKVMIINTHMDYKKEIKKEELESLSLLNGLFESDVKFLSGDLNLLPNTEYYQTLTKEWKDSYFEGKDKEMRSIEDPRIDYIFGDYSNNWKVKKSFFIKDDTQDWTKLSDHFPYMSIIDIK